MNPKHLSTLELTRVLARLADYASFSAGEEKARALVPAVSLREIRWRLEATSEATRCWTSSLMRLLAARTMFGPWRRPPSGELSCRRWSCSMCVTPSSQRATFTAP